MYCMLFIFYWHQIRNFPSNKCWSNSELNLQQTNSNARWRSLLGCSLAATYSKCIYALSLLTTTIRARTLAHTNTRNNFFSVTVSSSFYLLLLLRLLYLYFFWLGLLFLLLLFRMFDSLSVVCLLLLSV